MGRLRGRGEVRWGGVGWGLCVIKNNGGEMMGRNASGSGEQQFWGSIECEMGL